MPGHLYVCIMLNLWEILFVDYMLLIALKTLINKIDPIWNFYNFIKSTIIVK